MRESGREGSRGSCKQDMYVALYEKYHAYIRHIVVRKLKDFRNGNYVDTAFQETFLRIMKHAEKLQDVESKETKCYIAKIAETVSISIIRKKLKEEVNERSIEKIINDITYDRLVERNITTEELYRVLLKKFELLNAKEKKILIYKYLERKTNQEISNLLDISYDNACISVMRARRKLLLEIGQRTDWII